jgi:DNA-binding response OmpR family regulator
MAPSILLVDADANFRTSLRVALALEGVRVGEADSLEDACRALEQGDWTCAVVDLLLPLAEGRRVLDLLRDRGVALIACSAHPELLGSVHGAIDVLLKPFSPAALLEIAGRLVGQGTAAG